jgi:hypothetical protein
MDLRLHEVTRFEDTRRLGAQTPARHAPADIVLARLQAEEWITQVAAPAVDLSDRVGIDLGLTDARSRNRHHHLAGLFAHLGGEAQ